MVTVNKEVPVYGSGNRSDGLPRKMRCESTRSGSGSSVQGRNVAEKLSLIVTPSQPDYTGTSSLFVSAGSRPVGLPLLRDTRVRWPCGRVRTADAYWVEYAPSL